MVGEASIEVVQQIGRRSARGSIGVAADQHMGLEDARHRGVAGVTVEILRFCAVLDSAPAPALPNLQQSGHQAAMIA